MIELKPCPFCGSLEYELDNTTPADDGGYMEWRFCADCGTTVGNDDLWNTRPIEDALRARVVELEAALKKEHELSDAFYLLLVDDPNTRLLADKILITAYPLR